MEHIDWSACKTGSDGSNQVITIGFSQIIYTMTHRDVNRDSVIDHIWINCPRREVECIVIDNLNSDHN